MMEIFCLFNKIMDNILCLVKFCEENRDYFDFRVYSLPALSGLSSGSYSSGTTVVFGLSFKYKP